MAFITRLVSPTGSRNMPPLAVQPALADSGSSRGAWGGRWGGGGGGAGVWLIVVMGIGSIHQLPEVLLAVLQALNRQAIYPSLPLSTLSHQCLQSMLGPIL